MPGESEKEMIPHTLIPLEAALFMSIVEKECFLPVLGEVSNAGATIFTIMQCQIGHMRFLQVKSILLPDPNRDPQLFWSPHLLRVTLQRSR